MNTPVQNLGLINFQIFCNVVQRILSKSVHELEIINTEAICNYLRCYIKNELVTVRKGMKCIVKSRKYQITGICIALFYYKEL